jgi:3-dehydroquinate synthase
MEHAGMTTRIEVELQDRAYDIFAGRGLLGRIPKFLERTPTAKVAIVSDDEVARLHLAQLTAILQPLGKLRGTVLVPVGESSKSFGQLQRVCSELLSLGVERDDIVIALGGGVVGDLAGFAASILRRGVRFIQIPTTLLAQVDSSVGGKTGINTPEGKNLIGAFHQPTLVVADHDLLSTLPARHMRAGYAEIAKCALLGNRTFFEWLTANGKLVMERSPAALHHAVTTSIAMKAAIVVEDERETARRQLLNLGHTFGHALEAYAGYSERLLHGEAVAIGLCLAAAFSAQQGHCSPDTPQLIGAHLAEIGLPTTISDVPLPHPSAAQLLHLMRQDKKTKTGRITLILLRDIGNAFVQRDVDDSDIHAFLTHSLQHL